MLQCPSRLDVAKSCAKAMHPCIKKFVNLHTMLAMGLIAFVVHSSIVVYFLYTSFTAKLATKFLSLDSAAGVCSSITISQGEAHGIDKNGNWDVEPTYLSQESLYNVEFTEYQGNTSSWNSDMDALYSTMNTELDYLRSISDLPSKVLHLSSWRKTINATKSGSLFLKFNADPSFILDNPGNSLSVIFGPTSSSCPKDFDFWNLKDGILTVNYDVQFNNSGVPEQFCSNDDDFNMFDCGYDVKYIQFSAYNSKMHTILFYEHIVIIFSNCTIFAVRFSLQLGSRFALLRHSRGTKCRGY